ncbi:PE-PPE domain-containing protein, partial [Mycolicibacterium palauense]|uniref:PE-PPE domain-containing protein n=1 Tax=Mycolicibacterium palauense TaxID=2034511 RepID=UPI000BFED481
MNRATKAALTAAALPALAMPFSLGPAAVAGAASSGSTVSATDLLPAPGTATVLTHGPTPWAMSDNLQGAVCATLAACNEVYYSWIVSVYGLELGVEDNVDRVDFALENTDGAKVLYAFSGGARVATVWLSEHDGSGADDPDPSELTVVLIGNGGRKYTGASAVQLGSSWVTPDTDYTTIDIAQEYDPVADFPNDIVNLIFNPLAVANALMAFESIHMNYAQVDLDDPNNIVWTEGNTTYVFVPTEKIPLLNPLRQLGLNDLADALNDPLKKIIDRAYNRDYLPEESEGSGEEAAALAAISEGVSNSLARSSVEAIVPDAGAAAEDADGPSAETAEDGDAADATTDEATDASADVTEEVTEEIAEEVTEEVTEEATEEVAEAAEAAEDTEDATEETDESESAGAESTQSESSESESSESESTESESTESESSESESTQSKTAGSASTEAAAAESSSSAGTGKHRAPRSGVHSGVRSGGKDASDADGGGSGGSSAGSESDGGSSAGTGGRHRAGLNGAKKDGTKKAGTKKASSRDSGGSTGGSRGGSSGGSGGSSGAVSYTLSSLPTMLFVFDSLIG